MRLYAGIDLGGTDIKYGLINRQGRILYHQVVPSCAIQGPLQILERLVECGLDLMEQAKKSKAIIKYIGVGSPGTVDCDCGKILSHSPNLPGWEGTAVSGRMSTRLGLPVYVGNDANLMAIAETTFGAASGCKNALCLTLGTGIGGGIIVDGRLVIGSGYSGGEFGHIPIIKDGKYCKCGQRGCLETYAAAGNLLALARRELRKGHGFSGFQKQSCSNAQITIKELMKYYRLDDPIALQVLRIQADYLASGLAAAVHLLNPEAIVIGGGIAEGGGTKYIRLVRKLLKKRIFKDAYRNLKIVKARLGNKAGFMGAAIQRYKII